MKQLSLKTRSLFFLVISPTLLLAQTVASRPGPALPSDVLGPQLIAWSQVQKPQPASSANEASQSSAPVQPQAGSPAAQSFTGTIVKDGEKYILKAAGTTVYQLDDQERAKQYEGKQVRVAGKLDAAGNSLHVSSIELLS